MIQLFTTGGTIEGIDYVNDIGIADSNITIKDFLTNANIGFDYTIENVFKKYFHYGRYRKIYRKT